MKRKRVLALFLVLSIVFSSNGITALAAEADLNETAVSVNDESTVTTEIEAEEESNEPGEDAGTINDVSEEIEGEEDANETVTDAAEEETEIDAPQEERGESNMPAPRMLSFTDETGMTVAYDANIEYVYTVSEEGVLTEIKTSMGETVSGAVVIEEGKGITAIGETAFSGNTGITYVKLPSGVKTIDQNAFIGCTALTGITIPSGVTAIGNSAFEGCGKLIQLAIPKTLTTIGNRAFYNDSSLFMVYMKDALHGQLKTIGDAAFYGCKALTEFCSDTEFVFPEELTEIGESAFEECGSIKKIVLPESITTIGSRAFYKCTALSEVRLSKNLATISTYAFYGCDKLISVTFVSGNTTICEHAFENCYNLGSLVFPATLAEVQSYAFNGCSGLRSVEIPNSTMLFGDDNAFPNSSDLCLIGFEGSSTERYTTLTAPYIRFVSYRNENTDTELYKCTVQIVKDVGNNSIEIWLNDDRTKKANEENGGKGVKEGTMLYVAIGTSSSGKLTEGSLRCNGTVLTKNELGEYVFKMPKGGALITAEFENKSESTAINGRDSDVTVKLSNGAERSDSRDGVRLKIGQTTRIFLIDASDGNRVIPSKKIKFKSDKATIASVSSEGTVKALKSGEAKITATVTGNDGKEITRNIYIQIDPADVLSLGLKLSSGNNYVEIDSAKEIQVLTVPQAAVGKGLTFRASVTAYDEEGDDVSVTLKWASSDTTIVKPAKTSTTAAETDNMFTIPEDAGGEALVTVTAVNADKSVATGKFTVRVIDDDTPILTTSSLTFNPNIENGTVLELIGAYDTKISETMASTAVFVDGQGKEIDELDLVYDKAGSKDSVARFYIREGYELKDGTKTVYLRMLKNGYAIERLQKKPIKITVKSSTPNPKVAFDKKQEKINLFYANDGTEVVPVITNLGDAEIEEYKLEPLEKPASAKDNIDNEMFTDNFEVDPQSGVITQKSNQMLYTSQKKAAVTGYLVLKFKGYKDGINTKKYKITIPTQTVKPSYQLDKTSGTYKVGTASTVTLKLIDKKTKEKIVLDSGYEIINRNGDVVYGSNAFTVNGDGEIEFSIDANQKAGKAKFAIRHEEWAEEFEYTYTIKTTDKDPKISLQKSTVTLNRNYPDQPAEFMLTSNQSDTQFASEQIFEAPTNLSEAKQAEYNKLSITCDESGIGQVEILASDIAKGTYKYTCNVEGSDRILNKVTLSVKIAESNPTVSAKGSLSLNQNAIYSEAAELALTYKNLPQDYELDEPETTKSIVCTTKDAAGYEEYFSWGFEENKLIIGLQEKIPNKTYSFTMIPTFIGGGKNIPAKAIKFNVKVYEKAISVKLSTKGKLNLLDRYSEEYTDKNSIICTPAIANLKDTVDEARLFDVVNNDAIDYGSEESEYFDVTVLGGKLYVTPKEGADIESGKNYKLKVWVRLRNYAFSNAALDGGTWCTNDLTIKTAQTLPKLTADKTALSLYTSHKDYEATFKVSPAKDSIGKIANIVFDEKDEKSEDSFDLSCKPQEDGSLIVTMKLKTAAYPCNTTNKIKMYVIFEGQGINTPGTAITMNVSIISRN